MATIRKKGRRWEAAVARKSIRKSSTFATKLEAQMWAADIEKKIIGGGYLINDHTVEDLLQRYLSAVSIKKRGADKEKIRIMRLCRDPVAHLNYSHRTWHSGVIGCWKLSPNLPCSATGIFSRTPLMLLLMSGNGYRKTHSKKSPSQNQRHRATAEYLKTKLTGCFSP